MTALEISSSQSLDWLTGSFGEARVAKMGRVPTTTQQKFAHCEWLLWYDFNGIYE